MVLMTMSKPVLYGFEGLQRLAKDLLRLRFQDDIFG